jgi:hypothetical protein
VKSQITKRCRECSHRAVLVAGILLGLVIGLFQAAQAQSKPVNLERLVRNAGIIFSGKVVDVVTGEKEPNMNVYTTYYTFAVAVAVYGVDADSITIKQYGGEAGGRSYYPPGVPRFKRGEDVVVFFYPPSKIGMTSAVAKGQGKFLVGPADTSGRRHLENETRNRNLFRNVRHKDLIARQDWLQAGNEDSLEYEPFMASVRNLVGALKKQ